jgi:hypothetical protein
MTIPTMPVIDGYRVRRPLTAAELEFVDWRIQGSPDVGALLQTVVAAVFDALLTDVGETLGDYGPQRRLDPRQYAIPQTQWTAIASAVTDRAHAWGCPIEVGMELVNVMPSTYDDPTVTTPHLGPGDGRPHLLRLDVSRDAADEIAACEAHVQALAIAYGPDSVQHHEASHSWRRQLAALFSAQLGARTVVHRDGPLSLYVSTQGGFVFGVVFHGETRRCATTGCHATATTPTGTDTTVRWAPAFTDSVVLDHDHQPSYPFDAPQPGSWSSHS